MNDNPFGRQPTPTELHINQRAAITQALDISSMAVNGHLGNDVESLTHIQSSLLEALRSVNTIIGRSEQSRKRKEREAQNV